MKLNQIKVISFLLIVGAIYWSFTSLLPSKTTDLNTPKTEFSTARALVHLKEISKKPHYVGTEDHTRVKNYLIKQLDELGLHPLTQDQIAINEKWRAGTKAQNIMSRIKGTEEGNALVLLTHYDSAVHSSFGASDAGSGVVTILEGIRAYLAAGKRPKNDIIILFTDAEEVGLLGAVAFVKHHPWAKDVGLVLNFEARGSGGPSYMLLETNGGNKELIKTFNKAKANFPVANSLMYSIYKMLPNDTDLTIFREGKNINGFNFAFIDDHFDYHTALDTYENMDINTLAQQGDYMMTMLNHFSEVKLDKLNAKSDDIYFSFPKLGLISYPFSWVWGLFILAALLFFGITYYGVQKFKLTSHKMFAGFIPFLGALITSGFVAVFGWKLLQIIHPQYKDMLHGFTYNGHLYIAGFSALTLGILFWFYKNPFKAHSSANLMVAPLFIWGIINLLIAIYLKGAGFFILPVFAALAILAMLLFSKRDRKFKLIISTLLSIPTLLVFAPLVKMFPVGLGLKMLVVSAIFVSLLFGLLIPVFKKFRNTKLLANLFLGLGVLLLIVASFKASYNETRKQPTSLVYVIDSDENKAYWASYETELNDYNKTKLGENPTVGNFEKTVGSSKYNTGYKLYKQADVLALPQPLITKTQDTIIGANRHIKLQITSQRNANKMELIANNVVHFNSFTINGESLLKQNKMYVFDTEKKNHVLSYYFTEKDELLNFEFSVPKNEKPSFTLNETKYDLFNNELLNMPKRADSKTMATPFVVNDASIIKRKIIL
ncbi:MAG: M20/M25/M40 family metallo-hydrolase [Flavobacteriaceae bacterium]